MDGGPKITRLVGWNTYLHFTHNDRYFLRFGMEGGFLFHR